MHSRSHLLRHGGGGSVLPQGEARPRLHPARLHLHLRRQNPSFGAAGLTAGRSIVDQQVNLRMPRPGAIRRQPHQHQTSGTRQRKAGHCTATRTTCMCVCKYTIGCTFPSTSVCSAPRRPGRPCWPPERAPRCGASCCPHAPRPPALAGAWTCNTDRREPSDQSGSRPARRTSMADCANSAVCMSHPPRNVSAWALTGCCLPAPAGVCAHSLVGAQPLAQHVSRLLRIALRIRTQSA